jgi:hypothetical protein
MAKTDRQATPNLALFARLQEIERALAAGGPLPDDVRRDLWDIVRLLNKLVDETRLPPKEAAAYVPKALGLTGRAIGAYREARRADTAVGWLAWMKESGIVKRGQRKAFVAKLADSAGIEPSHIYRLARSRRARREK